MSLIIPSKIGSIVSCWSSGSVPEVPFKADAYTGLSAIDCVRYLLLENKKDRVFIFSRSGEMPSVRGAHADIELQYFTKETLHSLVENDEIPLPLLKQLFLREMDANGVDPSLLTRR